MRDFRVLLCSFSNPTTTVEDPSASFSCRSHRKSRLTSVIACGRAAEIIKVYAGTPLPKNQKLRAALSSRTSAQPEVATLPRRPTPADGHPCPSWRCKPAFCSHQLYNSIPSSGTLLQYLLDFSTTRGQGCMLQSLIRRRSLLSRSQRDSRNTRVGTMLHFL